MIVIETDFFRSFPVDDPSLPQIRRSLEAAYSYCGRSARIVRNLLLGGRHGQGVIVGIADFACAAAHEQRGQGDVHRHEKLRSHCIPPHCWGTFRSSGCLIRMRLQGRSFTDSVKSFRWSVAMRMFSIVYSMFCWLVRTTTCRLSIRLRASSSVFCSSMRSVWVCSRSTVMVPFALETVAFTLSTVGPSFTATRLAFSVRVCTFAVIWSILGDARAMTASVLARMAATCLRLVSPVTSFTFASTCRASVVMLLTSAWTDAISAWADCAMAATSRCMSSRLTVSSEGITAPACSRGASFVPVVMDTTGLLIRLTEPSFANDFAFTGVPFLTSNWISIRVGSVGSGRTTVTLPTVMPPNRTSVPGASPPAYFKYVR